MKVSNKQVIFCYDPDIRYYAFLPTKSVAFYNQYISQISSKRFIEFPPEYLILNLD